MKTARSATWTLTLGLTLAGMLPAPAPASQAQSIDEMVVRVHRVQYIEPETAYRLAVTECPQYLSSEQRAAYLAEGKAFCSVELLEEEGHIAVRADEETHRRIAELIHEVDRPPHTQLFHVILLAASDSADGNGTEELPAEARAAIDDLRALLPYSSYEVIGSAPIRTSHEAIVQVGRTGAAVRPGSAGDGDSAQAEARPSPFDVPFTVEMFFRGDARDGGDLYVQSFGLSNPLTGRLLGTSFGIRVGETVVVGTSKPRETEEALVVLLTAVER